MEPKLGQISTVYHCVKIRPSLPSLSSFHFLLLFHLERDSRLPRDGKKTILVWGTPIFIIPSSSRKSHVACRTARARWRSSSPSPPRSRPRRSRKNFSSVVFSGRRVSSSWNWSRGGLKKLHCKRFSSPLASILGQWGRGKKILGKFIWAAMNEWTFPITRMLFSYLFLVQNGFSLAAVGMTRAAAGCRTALALVIPTLAREKPFWPRKRYENTPILPMNGAYVQDILPSVILSTFYFFRLSFINRRWGILQS